MASHSDLKRISKIRLKTVDVLMKANDWDAAAYMMGYVLECALKAAICKTLHLSIYPDKSKSNKISQFFRTHEFDVLLTLSGMEDLFGFSGAGFTSWSGFTQEYKGSWTEMKYDIGSWDETKVRRVYTNLTAKKTGILSFVEGGKRW